jgi:hypothetical protein
VHPTVVPWEAHITELWQPPFDLADRDLVDGPWGRGRAPNPTDSFQLIGMNHLGVERDLTVLDNEERVWHVRQPDHVGRVAHGDSGVVLSRVLSAVGYHQPPVYFLRTFSLVDGSGVHVQSGGRFLLDERLLRDRGCWRWERNPFVGTTPYQALLVILMMFNGNDLTDDNNHLYEFHEQAEHTSTWYVVGNLANDLGERRFRLQPAVERQRLPTLSRFEGPYISFEYAGHQESTRIHISRHDVWWASRLLAGLTDRQWRDAFAAAGYQPDAAAPFIGRLKNRVAEGLRLGSE